MAIWSAGFVQQLPAPSMVRCESCPGTIGHITLGTKQTGAPSAGNPHAGCDVAGGGNGFTGLLLRHSQRKQGGTARPDPPDTPPVLDPTRIAAGNQSTPPGGVTQAAAVSVSEFPAVRR